MTYAAHHSHLAANFTHEASSPLKGFAKRPNVLWRIFDAIVESRQKSADREIARHLARSGGRITDNIEREITQGLLTGNWSDR
jgi:hypothetical protein